MLISGKVFFLGELCVQILFPSWTKSENERNVKMPKHLFQKNPSQGLSPLNIDTHMYWSHICNNIHFAYTYPIYMSPTILGALGICNWTIPTITKLIWIFGILVIRLMDKILHHLGRPELLNYGAKTFLSGAFGGADFFPPTVSHLFLDASTIQILDVTFLDFLPSVDRHQSHVSNTRILQGDDRQSPVFNGDLYPGNGANGYTTRTDDFRKGELWIKIWLLLATEKLTQKYPPWN